MFNLMNRKGKALAFVAGALLTFSCAQEKKSTLSSEGLELKRQPYLQMAWGDSATVTWKTNGVAKECKVVYGTSPENMNLTATGIVEDQRVNSMNIVKLKGLKPGTKYFYKVYSNDSLLAFGEEYYLRTEPAKGTNKYSYYAMGDIGQHIHKKGFPDVTAGRINDLPVRPDFGIGLGDIVYYKGESENYEKNFFFPMRSIMRNIPFYPALGNHDWGTNPKDNFDQEWILPGNEHYFSFDYQNTHFVALDSRNGDFYEPEKQVKWLEKDLADAQGKYDWIVVYLHHNGKTCSYKSDNKHVIDLYEVFARNNVDLLLNGHAHTYERLKPYDKDGNVIPQFSADSLNTYPEIKDGFISITTGAGGKLNRNWAPDPDNCDHGPIVAKAAHDGHFSLFSVDGRRLEMKVINSFNGEVMDSMVIDKN
ncbi:hypothetical protein FUAX_44610 (plasmid) [Fulvitalea axinellae]|uniref:Calcineurin-like phosphoesterase n=1 Tax=Fulvitalea axinellae TaxID=1182444 RepID=A0AAU9CIT2_9BACT|nr:hypothetical protein FUAX_44610 [Fulvitalea axinellae]